MTTRPAGAARHRPCAGMGATWVALLVLLLATGPTCGPGRALAVRGVLPGARSSTGGSRSGGPALRPAAGRPPLRLLFVGASVTRGWFASSWDRSYPAIVARRLGRGGRRVQVRVLAGAGATAEEAERWDLSVPSDVVVVHLATNDFVRREPVAGFAAAYAVVLHRLRAASPGAELVCMGGWDDPARHNRLGLTALDYDAAVRSACAAGGGRYLDLSAIYLDPANHGRAGRPTFSGPGDVFHPNDRGHAELAAAVLAALDVPVTAAASPPPARGRG